MKYKKGKIVNVTNLDLANKMFAMGILPGMHFEIIRKDLSGNTFYCLIEHYKRIALRKNEVESIQIEAEG